MIAGYKIDDLSGKGFRTLIEAYEAKQRHIDIYKIVKAQEYYFDIPITFDGSMSSEVFQESTNRVEVGETYSIQNPDGTWTNELITTATAMAAQREIVARTASGKLIRAPMTDLEAADYERHGDAFFGIPDTSKHVLTSDLQTFEWLLSTYKHTPIKTLLSWIPENVRPYFEQMPSERIVLEYAPAIYLGALSLECNAQSNQPTASGLFAGLPHGGQHSQAWWRGHSHRSGNQAQ